LATQPKTQQHPEATWHFSPTQKFYSAHQRMPQGEALPNKTFAVMLDLRLHMRWQGCFGLTALWQKSKLLAVLNAFNRP
jgi:hypothetical protein